MDYWTERAERERERERETQRETEKEREREGGRMEKGVRYMDMEKGRGKRHHV